VGRELHEDKVFRGLAELFPPWLGDVPTGEGSGYTHVEQTRATLAKFVNSPWEKAMASKNREKAGMFRVSPSSSTSSLQIVLHVGFERSSILVLQEVARKQPPIQDPHEVQGARLPGGQREEVVAPGPSSQEVCVPSLQLPGAGSGEDEPHAGVFHEPVNLVQEGWNLLSLIDDDRVEEPFFTGSQELLPKESRLTGEIQVKVGAEKVIP
jgi:hypothetical protein